MGFPIFMEPIAGSGERICVALAALSPEGRHQVVRTLKAKTARCMMGDAGQYFIEMVDLVTQSLNIHLAQGKALNEWAPPLGGVFPGQLEEAYTHDLPMMLRTLARNNAFLADPNDFGSDEGDDEATASRWLHQVKDALEQRRPDLVKNFSRNLKIVGNGRNTLFDYAGDLYCAQLHRLVPNASLSTQTRLAKSKLFDLETLRTVGHEGLFQFKTFEMIVYHPQLGDEDYNQQDIDRVREAFGELEEAGDKHQLRVIHFHSPEPAAERIIRGEMVA